jgi:hypothetical protein
MHIVNLFKIYSTDFECHAAAPCVKGDLIANSLKAMNFGYFILYSRAKIVVYINAFAYKCEDRQRSHRGEDMFFYFPHLQQLVIRINQVSPGRIIIQIPAHSNERVKCSLVSAITRPVG